jgi:hypothetical protein
MLFPDDDDCHHDIGLVEQEGAQRLVRDDETLLASCSR